MCFAYRITSLIYGCPLSIFFICLLFLKFVQFLNAASADATFLMLQMLKYHALSRVCAFAASLRSIITNHLFARAYNLLSFRCGWPLASAIRASLSFLDQQSSSIITATVATSNSSNEKNQEGLETSSSSSLSSMLLLNLPISGANSSLPQHHHHPLTTIQPMASMPQLPTETGSSSGGNSSVVYGHHPHIHNHHHQHAHHESQPPLTGDSSSTTGGGSQIYFSSTRSEPAGSTTSGSGGGGGYSTSNLMHQIRRAPDASRSQPGTNVERFCLPKPKIYRVLYPYQPQQPDELELQYGDLLTVTIQCDDGWFLGRSTLTGKFGTFPGNYVEPT